MAFALLHPMLSRAAAVLLIFGLAAPAGAAKWSVDKKVKLRISPGGQDALVTRRSASEVHTPRGPLAHDGIVVSTPYRFLVLAQRQIERASPGMRKLGRTFVARASAAHRSETGTLELGSSGSRSLEVIDDLGKLTLALADDGTIDSIVIADRLTFATGAGSIVKSAWARPAGGGATTVSLSEVHTRPLAKSARERALDEAFATP